ncbi:hypothetical protein I551_0631 [Mycobacterium ulcerans str. Harvey]|uniref:Uncharacterized protein n=1 Tax=Mycobacterium ulcerans str. Harvey TaxID=1299332 RepID=A0ABP3AP21_MYCUL|nr:hypothetical protein I551_0631 [Mycobacterium ulcerans str. Harvey]
MHWSQMPWHKIDTPPGRCLSTGKLFVKTNCVSPNWRT